MRIIKRPRKLLGNMVLVGMAHLERSFHMHPGEC